MRKGHSRLRAGGRKERGTMHKMRRARAQENRAPQQPPFASQVAFARLATALALTGLGAVAIGALVIRALVVKRARGARGRTAACKGVGRRAGAKASRRAGA